MNFTILFLIQITVTVLFSIMAVIFDVRRNTVPNLLTRSLLVFGIISNVFLSLISNNIKFILASIISALVTYVVTYMMWQLNIWGGGDVKLFTAIASVIPFGTSIDFLNVFPQLSVYPFSFSVVVNSILVSFPFLVAFVTYLIFKNNAFKRNADFLVNILNFHNLKFIIDSNLNRMVPVKDLKEGAIVNECQFNDEYVSELINEMDANLKVYRDGDDCEFKYCFKSQSAGGITKEEMYLLKIMNAQGFIGDEISVKVAFPFTPAILSGLMIALVYGDLIVLFTKNLVLVV